MKTDKDLKQIANLNTLKEHWKPLWVDIKKHVDKIKIPLVKIKYLEDKYHDYMEVVISTPELFNASGDYISNSYPHKISMDALIENEINSIKTQYNIRETTNKNEALAQQLPNNSFKLQSKIELESILNWLKKENYLDENITLPNFKKIFNEAKLTEITPVNWQGSSIASLRYFIRFFPIELSNPKRWQITAHCFTCNAELITPEQLQNAKQKLTETHQSKLDILKATYFA